MAPGWSVYDDDPRLDHLSAIRQSALVADLMAGSGPTVPLRSPQSQGGPGVGPGHRLSYLESSSPGSASTTEEAYLLHGVHSPEDRRRRRAPVDRWPALAQQPETVEWLRIQAKDPMSLFELQAWLGHRSPATTQSYAAITPTTLARAYTDAGYFARNLRTISVLIDRDAVVSGAAARGEPWQFFDLGHGHCTYSASSWKRGRTLSACCSRSPSLMMNGRLSRRVSSPSMVSSHA